MAFVTNRCRLKIFILVILSTVVIFAVPAHTQTLNGEFLLYFSNFPAIRIFYKDTFEARTTEAGALTITLRIDLRNASDEPDDADWAKMHTISVNPELEGSKQRIEFSFPITLYGQAHSITCKGYFLPSTQGAVITGLYYIDEKEQGAFVVRRDETRLPMYRHEE